VSGQEKNCSVPSSVVANDNRISKAAERLKRIGAIFRLARSVTSGRMIFQLMKGKIRLWANRWRKEIYSVHWSLPHGALVYDNWVCGTFASLLICLQRCKYYYSEIRLCTMGSEVYMSVVASVFGRVKWSNGNFFQMF